MRKQNAIKANMKKKEYASYFIDAFFFLVLAIVFLVDRFFAKPKFQIIIHALNKYQLLLVHYFLA